MYAESTRVFRYRSVVRRAALADTNYQRDRWIEALLGGRLRFHRDELNAKDNRTYRRWNELYATAY